MFEAPVIIIGIIIGLIWYAISEKRRQKHPERYLPTIQVNREEWEREGFDDQP